MSIATVSARAAEAPTCDELIARAHALVPYFAEQAARCELDYRVSDESVERFRDTGLHKTLMPAAYGGYEMGFSAMLETSVAIGKVCTSSAWVCGLYIVHNWVGALFPKEAQDELWGRDPGAFISGSYAPIGKATVVDGGYRLSGRFPFCSGSPGAAWNLRRRDAADRPRGQAGAGLHVGAEGRLQNRLAELASGRPCRNRELRPDRRRCVRAGAPDSEFLRLHRQHRTGDGIERQPALPHLVVGWRAVCAGHARGRAAAGALERFVDDNKVRQTHGAVVLGGKRIADFQTIQKRVGEAAARIDAARLVAQHAIDVAEREARQDGKSSMATRLHNRRAQSFIANEAKTAIDLIFDAAGGRCLQQSHPLQRAWRDVAAINHHISLNFDAVMSMYGQFAFGLPLEGQY